MFSQNLFPTLLFIISTCLKCIHLTIKQLSGFLLPFQLILIDFFAAVITSFHVQSFRVTHASMLSKSRYVFTPILFFASLAVFNGNARNYQGRRIHSDSTVEDIHNSLFYQREDPFAAEDKWAALSDSQREAWTAANDRVQLSDGIGEILRQTQLIRKQGISVPVEVQIVASEKSLPERLVSHVAHYASALKAAQNGTSLSLNVSVARQPLFKRLSMHSPSHDPADFAGILEQAAATLGVLNILFVIVNHGDEPVNEFASEAPFVGNGRVSWILYNIDKGHQLNIPRLLASAERAARRVYAPQPLYFPVPLIRRLHVDITAYTPGHQHRALWLQDFAWNEFEAVIRAVAVHDQSVAFFSSQSNAECPRCERAFRDVTKYDRDYPRKAALMLNNDVAPGATWAKGLLATSAKKRIPEDTCRLYILDTVKLHKTEYLQRLERRALASFPGLSIVTFRSSDKASMAGLESLFVKAFVSAAYGIADPDLYMHPRLGKVISRGTKRPSSVLFDVVARTLVRSVVEERLEELEEIVEGILYFDIDPTKSLGDREYAYFAQRVNLLLYKLGHAQLLLGESNNGPAATYMVSSTLHDIKAIRSAFDLGSDTKSFERFRDPTLRCHFSRLRREALKASQILKISYSGFKRLGVALFSFIVTAISTSSMLQRYSQSKSRGKRE